MGVVSTTQRQLPSSVRLDAQDTTEAANGMKRRYRQKYPEYDMSARSMDGDVMDMRADPVADGRSASSVYDQQEPWHSNPEVQMKNELTRPRNTNYLHRSHSAIPSSRNNDLAMNGDPRLSRSRNSVRSLKRQAPRPPGPPPKSLLPGIGPEGLALLTHQNISENEDTTHTPTDNVSPSAPSLTPPPSQFRTSPPDHEVMTPYRRYHQRSPRGSPTINKPKDPRAPLSLLALDDSYTQSSPSQPLLTRNYSGKRPDSFITNTSADDILSSKVCVAHKRTASPQLSNTSNNLEPQACIDSPDVGDDNESSEEDDMTIMRPGRGGRSRDEYKKRGGAQGLRYKARSHR